MPNASMSSEIPRQLKPLPRAFYRPSALEVAPALLGHWLVRSTPSGPAGGIIVETEAYLIGDPACHGAPGPTDRNRVMFGPPGHAYVYFIYGCHYCANVVCLPPNHAEAVLIRAIEPLFGLQFMARARPVAKRLELTSGPGKLCQALKITRRQNGSDLCDPSAELYVARNPRLEKTTTALGPRITTTRIGLTKAATLPLRFYLSASHYVSRKARTPAM